MQYPAPLTRSTSHCCAAQRRLQVRKRCRLRKCESQRVTHCGGLLPSFTVHASALLQPCVTNAAGPALLAFDIGGLIEYSDEPEVSMYTRQAPRRRMTCGRVVFGVRREFHSDTAVRREPLLRRRTQSYFRFNIARIILVCRAAAHCG